MSRTEECGLDRSSHEAARGYQGRSVCGRVVDFDADPMCYRSQDCGTMGDGGTHRRSTDWSMSYRQM